VSEPLVIVGHGMAAARTAPGRSAVAVVSPGEVADALRYLALIRSREPIAGIRADTMSSRALSVRATA